MQHTYVSAAINKTWWWRRFGLKGERALCDIFSAGTSRRHRAHGPQFEAGREDLV